MTRGIDDIDRVVTPLYRGILRLDGNPLLTLKIHGVHGALAGFLVITIGATCLEQFINEGGFAMVNVGDDGDITDLFCHAWKVVIPCHLKNGPERRRTLLHF